MEKRWFLSSIFPEGKWSDAQGRILETLLKILTPQNDSFFTKSIKKRYKRQLIAHFSKINKIDQLTPLFEVNDNSIEFLSDSIISDDLGYKMDSKAGVLLLKNILANEKALKALKEKIAKPLASINKEPIKNKDDIKIWAKTSYSLVNFILENSSQLDKNNIIEFANEVKNELFSKKFSNELKNALLETALHQEAFNAVNEMLKQNQELKEINQYELLYSIGGSFKSADSCSLLHLAVIHGNFALAQELFDPNKQTPGAKYCNGITPVMMAVYMGRLSTQYNHNRRKEVLKILHYIYEKDKNVFTAPATTDPLESWVSQLANKDFDKLKNLLDEFPELITQLTFVDTPKQEPRSVIGKLLWNNAKILIPDWNKINYIVEKVQTQPKARAIKFLELPINLDPKITLLKFAKIRKQTDLVNKLTVFGITQ